MPFSYLHSLGICWMCGACSVYRPTTRPHSSFWHWHDTALTMHLSLMGFHKWLQQCGMPLYQSSVIVTIEHCCGMDTSLIGWVHPVLLSIITSSRKDTLLLFFGFAAPFTEFFPLFREPTLVLLLVEEARERDCREGTLGSNEGAAGYKWGERGNHTQRAINPNCSLTPRPTPIFVLQFAMTILHRNGKAAKNGEGLGEFITWVTSG